MNKGVESEIELLLESLKLILKDEENDQDGMKKRIIKLFFDV